MPNSFVAVVYSVTRILGHLEHFSKMPKVRNKLQKNKQKRNKTKNKIK